METTKLSSNGRVVLPKSVRDAHGWGPRTEFIIESTLDGIFLRAKSPFVRTQLDQVFGSVRYAGPAKSLDEMGAGIRTAARRRHRDRAHR
jgi:AbrB family looped-hinge helix DNA binding protein